MNVYYIIDYLVGTRESSFCFRSVNSIHLDQQIFKDFFSNLIFNTNIKTVKNISFFCPNPPKNKDFLCCAVCVICIIFLRFFTTIRLYLHSYDNHELASATGSILKCCHVLDNGFV